MTGSARMIVKFATFAVIMVVLTVFLFITFAQYRAGSTNAYSAIFTDASRLTRGDTVRVAGIRVGTVDEVSLRPDHKVEVAFDADRTTVLTAGTKAAIRYLNLTGDRYLELVDGPGSTRMMPPGSQIPDTRTQPALDLDLLLSGLKPVIQGLNPRDVNALASSLIQVFQGQGGTLDSLLSNTSSFTTSLADKNQVVEQLIDNLQPVLKTLSDRGDEFSATIDHLEKLVSGLATDRDPIGTAIESLDRGTASIADLLGQARPPLAGTVEQLSRVAPLLDDGKDILDGQIQKLPADYRKLQRIGSYGAFINFYQCRLALRVTDFQGRTAVFPYIEQENGRCAEP